MNTNDTNSGTSYTPAELGTGYWSAQAANARAMEHSNTDPRTADDAEPLTDWDTMTTAQRAAWNRAPMVYARGMEAHARNEYARAAEHFEQATRLAEISGDDAMSVEASFCAIDARRTAARRLTEGATLLEAAKGHTLYTRRHVSRSGRTQAVEVLTVNSATGQLVRVTTPRLADVLNVARYGVKPGTAKTSGLEHFAWSEGVNAADNGHKARGVARLLGELLHSNASHFEVSEL